MSDKKNKILSEDEMLYLEGIRRKYDVKHSRIKEIAGVSQAAVSKTLRRKMWSPKVMGAFQELFPQDTMVLGIIAKRN